MLGRFFRAPLAVILSLGLIITPAFGEAMTRPTLFRSQRMDNSDLFAGQAMSVVASFSGHRISAVRKSFATIVRFLKLSKNRSFNPDRLFDTKLPRPVKIYLTLDVLTTIAQYMESVVISWYVAKVTGSASVGIVFFAYQSLYSFSPIMGSILDNYQQKNWKLFRYLLFVRMIPISILGVLTYYSIHSVAVAIIASLFLVNGIIQSGLGPLFSKVFKEIAVSSGMDEQPQSLRNFLQGMARGLGPAVAWLLFATIIHADKPQQSAFAYWFSACAFGLMAMATLLPKFLPTPEVYKAKQTQANPSGSINAQSVFSHGFLTLKKILNGVVEIVRKEPILTLISVGFIAPYQIAIGSFFTITAPLVGLVRHGGPTVLALLSVSSSLGAMACSFISYRWGDRPIHLGKLMLGGALGSAVIFAAVLLNPTVSPLIWYTAMFLSGLSAMFFWEIYFKVAFSMRGELIGRAVGLLYLSVYGGLALGSLIAGPVLTRLWTAQYAAQVLSIAWLGLSLAWIAARFVIPKMRQLFELKLSQDSLPPTTLEATMMAGLRNPSSPLRRMRRKASSILESVVRESSLVVIAAHNLPGLPPDADALTYLGPIYARITDEANRQGRELVVVPDAQSAVEAIQAGKLCVVSLPISDDNEGFSKQELASLARLPGKKALYVGDIRYRPDLYPGLFEWVDVEDHHGWPSDWLQLLDTWNKNPNFNVIHTPTLFKQEKEARFFSAGHLASWMFRDEVFSKKVWTRWDFFTLLSILGDRNQKIFPEFLKNKKITPDLLKGYEEASKWLTFYGMLIGSSDRTSLERGTLLADTMQFLSQIPATNPSVSLDALNKFLADRLRPFETEREWLGHWMQETVDKSVADMAKSKQTVVVRPIEAPYDIISNVHGQTIGVLNQQHGWNEKVLVHYQIYWRDGHPIGLRVLASRNPDAGPNVSSVFLNPFTGEAWGGGAPDNAGGLLSWEDISADAPWRQKNMTEKEQAKLLFEYDDALAAYRQDLSTQQQVDLASFLEWFSRTIQGPVDLASIPRPQHRQRRTFDGRFTFKRGGSPADVLVWALEQFRKGRQWVTADAYFEAADPDVTLETVKNDFAANVESHFMIKRTRGWIQRRTEFQLTEAGRKMAAALGPVASQGTLNFDAPPLPEPVPVAQENPVKFTYFGGNEIRNGGILLEDQRGDKQSKALIDAGSSMDLFTQLYHQMYNRPRTVHQGPEDLWLNGLLPRIEGLFRPDLLSMAKKKRITRRQLTASS